MLAKALTAFVQDRFWRLGRVFQLENPLLCWMRDRASASGFGRRQGEQSFRTLLVPPPPRAAEA
jgi:hypothetical protein